MVLKKFKLFIISFCFMCLSNPAIAEFDEESYYYGYFKGWLSSTCFNYKKGFLNEERAKRSFKTAISVSEKMIQNNSYKIKLLEYGSSSNNLECKKLMP